MPLVKNSNNSSSRSSVLSNVFWIILVLILLSGNIIFGIKYFSLQKEFQETQANFKAQELNQKVLDFAKLFIEKILEADTEVHFETRLNLENAVRGLNDEVILTQWQKFVESETEIDAQTQAKNLLKILVDKIKIQ